MELGVTLVFLFSCASLLSNPKLFYALDTITTNRSINDGQTIISSGRNYELGFFSPENSTYRYVGIWYCRERVSIMTVVWVANREAPLANTSGQLQVTNSGNLVLVVNGTNHLIWSSNSSKTVQNPIARLLDSGNLVLRDENDDNPENFLWQSYDHPTDTLFQSMRLGKNFETGQEISLTSWKNKDDPTPGDYTYHCNPTGYPQLFIRRRSAEDFRSGPWDGHHFNGMPNPRSSDTIYTHILVFNEKEVYFQTINSSVISRAVLSPNGVLRTWAWVGRTMEWMQYFSVPADMCDTYSLCGPYGTCNSRTVPVCECLENFVPRNETEWNRTDWSNGCMRRTSLDCQNDGFLKYSNVKLPDTRHSRYNERMTLRECGAVCLMNCSCIAYANMDQSGSGCFLWFSELIDIRELSEGGKDMYLRMAASELEYDRKEKWHVPVIVISIVSGMLLFVASTWCITQKRKQKKGLEQNKDDIDLPLYNLATITAATDNFSSTNMIGKGGFGAVYKGMLSTGQEIAVKRLSNTSSGQGVEEFKNEIILISRLQHRNLVRLLGCCLEGEERMLIYEYMPNKSLDYFIFDQDRTSLLTWQIRFEIAMGIAKGLLYLHQDSRLRIIHRDLKASNVLLDSELNPKISDFGIARAFLGDQIESETRRVIGTYGYMSPEYAIEGKFSMKSDAFSFGVMLLEIVGGKRNSGFRNPDHHHSLLGHVWLLWNEGRALELVDSCLKDSFFKSQVIRCIQVGLLCVQTFPKDRPTMSSVVMMLGSEDVMLPQPKQPGFFIETGSIETHATEGGNADENGITITVLEAR